MKMLKAVGWFAALTGLLLTACRPPSQSPAALTTPETSSQPLGLKVLAVESFLADIAQNVAGNRLHVDTLLPPGFDPHAFEPTPKDLARMAESQVLIVNGAGLESRLGLLLENVGGERLVIEAAAGLPFRQSGGQMICGSPAGSEQEHEQGGEGDPHFWFDPNLVIRYVENIRAGLSQADPSGGEIYARNAEAYISSLKELDAWIAEQVAQIPPERRLLVTNHESLGYFADRYGFRLVGTILPSFSSVASPSARELAQLVDCIKSTRAPAIFLETGSNPQLAQQVAQESGVHVVTELYSHSLSPVGGPAPTYLEMMRYNVRTIVEALGGESSQPE